MGYDRNSVHAEEGVIDKFSKHTRKKQIKHLNVNKFTFIVIRVDKEGNLKESCPCTNCLSVISSVGIKKVTYSRDDGTIITKKIKDISSRYSKAYRSCK